MEVLKKYQVQVRGISPLVMHSDKLCNPLHPITKQMKELSSIRKKQDEHYLAMARIEWEAGLYYNDELGLYMPSKCFRGCLRAAAKKFRLGKQIKAITIDAAVGVPLLGYQGMTPEDLWNVTNKKGEQLHVFSETVVVSQARIIRTRPVFYRWDFAFDLYLNVELLAEAQLKVILDTAGFEYGLCELRPETGAGVCGRFEIAEFKKLN